ncbi:MAG: hypothetical protein ACKOER_01040 [Betaproteobacteria bacterium]
MHGALHEIHASDEAQRRATADTMARLFGLPGAPTQRAACPHNRDATVTPLRSLMPKEAP